MMASQATDITDQNNLQMQVSVYPNPAADYITITNIPNGSTIKITDITGRTFYSAPDLYLIKLVRFYGVDFQYV